MADSSFYMRYSNTFYDTLADKAKKQKYLIDNILNQGYDKDDFTKYMVDRQGMLTVKSSRRLFLYFSLNNRLPSDILYNLI
jgi:hypothetical protein